MASWPGPSPSDCATRSCTPPACWCAPRGAPHCASLRVGPGPTTSWRPSLDCRTGPAPDQVPPILSMYDTELIEHVHRQVVDAFAPASAPRHAVTAAVARINHGFADNHTGR